MFLTVHAAAGMVIGQHIVNPWLAFLIGFFSHILFDIIPHGDTKVPQKYKNPIHIATAGLIDLMILFIFIIFIIFFTKVEIHKFNIIMAVFGSMLPDLLQAAYYMFRKRWLKKIQNLHHFFHNLISHKYELNFWNGLTLQIIIFIILTIII